MLKERTNIRLEAANGTPIKKYGEKFLSFRTDGAKEDCEMKFLITDVKKTLAAVSAIVAAGNIVVFKPTKHGSFIQNEKTGSKVWLTGEKGTYSMEAEFLDLVIGGVNEEEKTREVGFRGPA